MMPGNERKIFFALENERDEAGGAGDASPTSRVDLADHAPSAKCGVRGGRDSTDKLMARYAAIVHVAARDLEVGATDSGERYADDTFSRRLDGLGIVGAKLE